MGFIKLSVIFLLPNLIFLYRIANMDTENEFLETLVDHFLANIRRTYVRAPEPESLSSVRNQAKKLEEYLRSNSNHPTVAAMIENALSKFEFEVDFPFFDLMLRQSGT